MAVIQGSTVVSNVPGNHQLLLLQLHNIIHSPVLSSERVLCSSTGSSLPSYFVSDDMDFNACYNGASLGAYAT